MLLYQILRPASYLLIKHPQKWKFDWLVPFALSILSAVPLIIYANNINIFGSGGFVEKVASFIQILPGFYIAALAAIATFNRSDIDQYIPEPTPELGILIGGERNIIKLTRRRFLCMLFAFLTASSLLLCVLAIFSTTFANQIKLTLPADSHIYIISLFIVSFTFLFWQLVVATSLGLYYLGDRLNQPE